MHTIVKENDIPRRLLSGLCVYGGTGLKDVANMKSIQARFEVRKASAKVKASAKSS